ncbi:MAG: ATP-binding cassette domain-containing protein [Deltaproteobacteria bacterium]
MSSLLEFKELRRHFEGEQGRYVMESAILETGMVLVLKGPSGVGKSTLLKTLARLVQPQGGHVYLQGRDWMSFSSSEWRRLVHYVPQKPAVFGGSLEDNLQIPFGLRALQGKAGFDRSRALTLLGKTDIPANLLAQSAATLSGGEAARMALVRAMLIDPQILLLDEPTAYLDGENRNRAMQLISDWVNADDNRGVVMVSHNDEDLESLPGVSVLNITVREGV